jgi:CrcB protein
VDLWQRIAMVGAGGAVGSVCRYLAAVFFGAGPVTTFWVNVIGSLLIGVIAGATPPSDLRIRLFLATGVLGGFTTFSAWQLEALMATQAREWTSTAAILFGSLAAGFVAVATGYWIGSRVFSPS